MNEWTKYTKVNNLLTCNKFTLISSGPAIDEPMNLLDGGILELTLGQK